MTRYAIQNGYLSTAIYAGRLDAKGRVFLDKTDATADAFYAVAEFVRDHHDCAATITVNGLRMEVDVYEVEAENGDDL